MTRYPNKIWLAASGDETAVAYEQADAILPLVQRSFDMTTARDDLGIVLSALRDLEQAVGEKFDDDDGVIAEIERDHMAVSRPDRWNLKVGELPESTVKALRESVSRPGLCCPGGCMFTPCKASSHDRAQGE